MSRDASSNLATSNFSTKNCPEAYPENIKEIFGMLRQGAKFHSYTKEWWILAEPPAKQSNACCSAST